MAGECVLGQSCNLFVLVSVGHLENASRNDPLLNGLLELVNVSPSHSPHPGCWLQFAERDL
jgi:hypothetical protein